jgi:hypothetical protein
MQPVLAELGADRRPDLNPSPTATPITPNAFARSFGCVWSEMYACAVARLPAVMPSRMRPTNTIHSAFEYASITNPAHVPNWLIRSSGLRPYRSLRLPMSGVDISEHTAYTLTSVVATSGVAPKCSA